MANIAADIPLRPSGINTTATNVQSSDICALPNELLIQILARLPTKLLLHVAPVCHLFQDLTACVIRTRLLQALLPKDFSLQLRCHHPAADFTKGNEYYNYLSYLGTPGLGDADYVVASPNNDDAAGTGVRGLYSRFGPAQRGEQKGDVGRAINMDGHELFSQLCTSLTLISVVQYGHVHVQKERTVRLWRDWLAKYASNPIILTQDSASMERRPSPTTHEYFRFSSELDRTIWTDQSQNVGLRVRVHDRRSSLQQRDAQLHSADEDQPVSYDIYIEELIIRSTFLLDSLERLSVSNKDWTSMALIFGYLMAQYTN